jgi:hypothetical protein
MKSKNGRKILETRKVKAENKEMKTNIRKRNRMVTGKKSHMPIKKSIRQIQWKGNILNF